MQQHEIQIVPEQFYHIYNRGTNGQAIFFEERNYAYFLKRYADYLDPVLKTYAYCLRGNHFHLLVQVREAETLKEVYAMHLENSSRGRKKETTQGIHSPDKIVSKLFASFFNSYSQSIARAYHRTGALMESPFKRKIVDSPIYFKNLMHYIHHNPQHHGLVDDFRDYPYSSYHSFMLAAATRLPRAEVLNWYGNKATYATYHSAPPDWQAIEHLFIEF